MRCPGCGFPANSVQIFQLSDGDLFPERRRWTRDPQHLETLGFYSWFLAPLKCARVLDLGSGPGTVAIPLTWLENVAAVVCFDVDLNARSSLLKDKATLGITKLEVAGQEGQPHALPFPNESFDAIVARYSMHHFPDQPGCIREIARILKPGGVLLYSDPAMPTHSRNTTDSLYRRRETTFHGYRTYHEMLDLVRSGGLEVLTLRPYEYQRGTLDDFLKEQPAELRAELIDRWLQLDDQTKRELKWSGVREGPFIRYPIIDLAAIKSC